jgi:hypothetical protein
MDTIQFLDKNGFCATDKICVFCSITTDGWNAFCYKCKDYKGMMNIVQAVNYYGKEILPL